jgi:adenylyltransferase/sulfurtransferase
MTTEETELRLLFNRQLPVYTEAGQQKLRDSTVLIIGCGGLGSTVATVLSRSGVGHLVLVDNDTVSLHNIHRQFLYTAGDVDKSKAECATVCPQLCLSRNTAIATRIDEPRTTELIEQYKPVLVVDCTDNFTTRFALNRACIKTGVPLVFGSVTALQGQLSVFAHFAANPKCPCWECIHPEPPPPLPAPPPVVPVICSVLGTLQAEQAIALITGVGDLLIGELLTVNLDKLTLKRYRLRERSKTCKACGVGEITTCAFRGF